MSLSNEHLLEYNFYLERASIPQGWEVASLEEVSYVVTDGTHKTPEYKPSGVRFISIKNIRPFSPVNWNSYEKYISQEEHLVLIKRCRPEYDDILFPRIGTLGYAKRIDFHEEISIFVGLGLVKPVKQYVSSKFLEFYLNTPYIARLSEEKANGTGRMTLPLEESRRFPVPLPPLNEQHRIVAKIEELFSELDQGIAALKTAREQLKVYRQALLKHAFEGKLTAPWREQRAVTPAQAGVHADEKLDSRLRGNDEPLEPAAALLARIQAEREQRYQQQLQQWQAHGGSKPKAPKPLPPLSAEELAELPELPEGWGWVKLGEFIETIEAGKSFKCDEREPNTDEIGVAKVSAVTWGEYDESESKTCIDSAKENDAYLIQSGDFILSRANTIDLVGACVIAKQVTKKIMLSDKTLRIRFDGFAQEYFLQYLRSRFGRKQIMLLSTGNQESMRNIGQDRIRSIVVPICSNEEAKAVMEVLASKLSEADQLELTLATSLQQAEALRQSILKRAFSGRLVPQDPGDEPAAALLARIRAGKDAQSAVPRKTGKGKA